MTKLSNQLAHCMAQSLAETWRPVEGTDVRDTERPFSKESKEMQYKLFPPEEPRSYCPAGTIACNTTAGPNSCCPPNLHKVSNFGWTRHPNGAVILVWPSPTQIQLWAGSFQDR